MTGRELIEVTVHVDDGIVCVLLDQGQWQSVSNGQPLRVRTSNEDRRGKVYEDIWTFGGGLKGRLLVEHGQEGSIGFYGRLEDAIFDVIEAPVESRQAFG